MCRAYLDNRVLAYSNMDFANICAAKPKSASNFRRNYRKNINLHGILLETWNTSVSPVP